METVISTKDLNVFYDSNQALYNINIKIEKNKVTALIGPSGCGKSTFLRTLNRMNDLIEGTKVEGEVIYHNQNIYDRNIDVNQLRVNIGMVFQKANPFPMTIFENVAYGPKAQGVKKKEELQAIVESSLREAAL